MKQKISRMRREEKGRTSSSALDLILMLDLYMYLILSFSLKLEKITNKLILRHPKWYSKQVSVIDEHSANVLS